MSRRRASWVAVAALAATLQAASATAEYEPLGVNADMTFASKYMIDGFNIGGDNPVFEPSVSKELLTPGLSLMFWSALQINRSNQQWDELDLMARYTHTIAPRSPFAMTVQGMVDYWYFPRSNDVELDGLGNEVGVTHRRGNKVQAGFSFPYLLPVPVLGSYLVPSYSVGYWITWAQNRRDRYQGGAKHEGRLDYYRSVPRFIPGVTNQYVGLGGSMNYHDGAFKVKPGWSHAVAQVATGANALGMLFSLSANYQWSFERTVDPQNELWTTFSLSKEF